MCRTWPPLQLSLQAVVMRQFIIGACNKRLKKSNRKVVKGILSIEVNFLSQHEKVNELEIIDY